MYLFSFRDKHKRFSRNFVKKQNDNITGVINHFDQSKKTSLEVHIYLTGVKKI